MRSVVAWLSMCACAGALADTITLSDGQVLSATVIGETADEVVVSPDPDAAVAIRQVIPRASIREIVRDVAPEGTTYFEVPLIGTVGEEITAAGIGEALAVAREQKASYVILLIDSPGGMVSELSGIIRVMEDARDLDTVAFVKRAHSAAALIAGACDRIVMYPAAQIGAAAPYAMANGVPQAVEAKVVAQVRAMARTAAQIGGHNPDVFESMVDPQVEVELTPTIKKPSGGILMLNDSDAVACQVATGICRNYGELRRTLNVDAWSARSGRGKAIMAKHAEQHRSRVVEVQFEKGQADEVQQYRETAVPELQQLRQRIVDAQAGLEAAMQSREEAKQRRDYSLKRISMGVMPDYEQQKDTPSAGFYLNRNAESDRLAMEAVERDYQKRMNELSETITRLQAQLKADTARAKELINASPLR